VNLNACEMRIRSSADLTIGSQQINSSPREPDEFPNQKIETKRLLLLKKDCFLTSCSNLYSLHPSPHFLKNCGYDALRFLVFVAMELTGGPFLLCVILNAGGASSGGGGFLFTSSGGHPFHLGCGSNVSWTRLLFVFVPYGLKGGSSSCMFGGGGGTFFSGSGSLPIGPITSIGLLNVP
jgi:hypothetical protein